MKKQLNHIIPFMISLVIFIIFKTPGGGTTSFIQPLIISLLTFVILELKMAEGIVNNTVKAINEATSKIEESKNSLIESKDELQQHTSSLSDASTKLVDTIDYLSRYIDDSPNPDDLSLGLVKNEADDVSKSMLLSFREYSNAWINYAKVSNVTGNTLAAYNWCKLIDTYLHQDISDMNNGKLFTSSKTYTNIVTDCCDELHKRYPNSEITLFLVTAMLPNEFFNWPQAELYVGKSPFEIIEHTWKGADDYFNKMEQLKQDIKIRRCILLKHDDDKSLPFLRTLKDLKNSSDYWIYNKPLKYGVFPALDLEDLFQEITNNKYSYKDASNFTGIDSLSFYPIGKKCIFENSEFQPQNKLIDLFIEKLHSSNKDALYYSVGKGMNIKNELFSDGKSMPEMAVFKIDGVSQFGLIGYLRPYTESMYMKFVCNINNSFIGGLLSEIETKALYLNNI